MTVPNKIDGYPVTKIGDEAFSGCVHISKLVLPNSITEIGDYAFSSCTRLSAVNIPESVSVINTGIFTGCKSLKTFEIPKTIAKIDRAAFLSSGLCYVSIPNSVKTIETEAFGDCESLNEIVFTHSADDILSIANGALHGYEYYVYNISVTIYVSDTNNINSAITGYEWPETQCDVKYSTLSSLPSHGSSENLEYEINGDTVTIIGCNTASSGQISIPCEINGYSVTTIKQYAFYSCNKVTEIVIPSSVTEIDQDAFRYADGLTSISVLSENENFRKLQ